MIKTKLTPEQLENGLAGFCGTEGYFRWNPILFRNVVLTDGARYLADEAEAYWLMDMIASYVPKIGDDWFALARLTVTGKTAIFNLEDGNNNVIATQEIPYTDFPLPEMKLYVEYNGENLWVILLPGEH